MSHPERISDLKDKVDQLDFKGIEFIMKLRDVDIFERKNPWIFVNVLGYDNEKKHCYLIKDMSRLLSSPVSKHEKQVYFCRRCLSSFSTLLARSKNIEIWKEHDPVTIFMPEEDGKVELTTSNCKMPVPSVCHVDFECFTEKIETCESNLFCFCFLIFKFFLFLFFYNMILTLTTLRFLSWDSLRILRYTTYLQHPSDTINIYGTYIVLLILRTM